MPVLRYPASQLVGDIAGVLRGHFGARRIPAALHEDDRIEALYGAAAVLLAFGVTPEVSDGDPPRVAAFIRDVLARENLRAAAPARPRKAVG